MLYEEYSTPLGVITGSSVPRISPGPNIVTVKCFLDYSTCIYSQKGDVISMILTQKYQHSQSAVIDYPFDYGPTRHVLKRLPHVKKVLYFLVHPVDEW